MYKFIVSAKNDVTLPNKSWNFFETPGFKSDVKRLKLTDSDIEDLKTAVCTHYADGLGNNIYKLRWSPKSWKSGKRGGTRVIYIEYIQLSAVYLVRIYAKNEKSDLTKQERDELKKLSSELKQ